MAAVYTSSRLNALARVGRGANLEQAWREVIPVESFTKDPADPTPVLERPEVGIRWGKPADFEFDLDALKQSKKRSPMEIREVPRYYFENEITDFTELWRSFRTGKVNVLPSDVIPEYPPGMNWVAYIEMVKGLNEMLDELNPVVELEELRSWISDSGVTWTRMDSNGDPVANVTVYYEFTISDHYIPFKEFPRPKMGERGEHPEK